LTATVLMSIHVGRGAAERAEIRERSPDGDWSSTYRVLANQFVIVDRARPQAAYRCPGRSTARSRATRSECGLDNARPQVAMTSFTCMIGSIFV
jgi:hypothetical protein